MSGWAPISMWLISCSVLALYSAMRPLSVFTLACMATATTPSRTATLLISAPASTAVPSMRPTLTGAVGLLRSSTSTAPARALTTKLRLLAAS
ncbi:hypothetical protein D3C85_1638530 [compost metagenome]